MNEFIIAICEVLDIKPPKISYDTSHFQSDTMLAQIDSNGDVIYIKPNVSSLNQFYAIAHELRHAWQINVDKDFYFVDYKTVDKCNSIEEYNLQPAEIDANAFVVIALSDYFGVKPLFNSFSDKVKLQIQKRISEIVAINE